MAQISSKNAKAKFVILPSNVSKIHQCQIVIKYNELIGQLLYGSEYNATNRKHRSNKGLSDSHSKASSPLTPSPLSIVNLFPKLNVSNINGLIRKGSSNPELRIYPLNVDAQTSEHFFVNHAHFQYSVEKKIHSNCVITLEIKPRIRYRISGKRDCLFYQVATNNDQVRDVYLLLRYSGIYWVDILVRERRSFYSAQDMEMLHSFQNEDYVQGTNNNNGMTEESMIDRMLYAKYNVQSSITPQKVTHSSWKTGFSYWFYNNTPNFEHTLIPNPSLFHFTKVGNDTRFQVLSPLQDTLPRGRVVFFQVKIDTSRFRNPSVLMEPQDFLPKRLIALKENKPSNIFITQTSLKKHGKKTKNDPIFLKEPCSNELQLFETCILLDGFSNTNPKAPQVYTVVFQKEDYLLTNPIIVAQYDVCEIYSSLDVPNNSIESLPPLHSSSLQLSPEVDRVLTSYHEIQNKPHIKTVPVRIGNAPFLVYGAKSENVNRAIPTSKKQNWLLLQKEFKVNQKHFKGYVSPSQNSYFFLPKLSPSGNTDPLYLRTLPAIDFQTQNSTSEHRIRLQSRQLRKMQEIFDRVEDDDVNTIFSESNLNSRESFRQSKLHLDVSGLKRKISQNSSYSGSPQSLVDVPLSLEDASSESSHLYSSSRSSSIDAFSSGLSTSTGDYEDLSHERGFNSSSRAESTFSKLFEYLSPDMESLNLSNFDTISETAYTVYSDAESIQKHIKKKKKKSEKKPLVNIKNAILKNHFNQPSSETVSDVINSISNQNNPKKKKKKKSDVLFARCIKLRHGHREMTFEYIPKVIPLSSHDIRHALGLTAQQLLFLKIVGLYDPKKRVTYSFIPDKKSGSTLLEKQYLDENTTYDVLVEDTRDADIDLLTPEEKESIYQKFKVINKDGSGEISFDEANEYYTEMEKSKLNIYIDMLDKLLKDDPSKREEIEKRKKNATTLCQQLIEQHIQSFIDADIDKSGTIDIEEFLRHEGRLVLAKR